MYILIYIDLYFFLSICRQQFDRSKTTQFIVRVILFIPVLSLFTDCRSNFLIIFLDLNETHQDRNSNHDCGLLGLLSYTSLGKQLILIS